MTTTFAVSTSPVAAGPGVSSQLFGSLLIGLREGLETAIVVTILIAFLVESTAATPSSGSHHVAAAIAMTIGVFLTIQLSENTISRPGCRGHRRRRLLVAVIIVTTMVLWMRKAAATISGELRSDMARALETGAAWPSPRSRSWPLGRDVETALFMVGRANASTAWPLADS